MSFLASTAKTLPSLGFSGAGFLTSYHLGAADCLLKRGFLLPRGELPEQQQQRLTPPVLTGVSGGALVATAVSIGVRPEDGMAATLAIADYTRKTGGILDHLRPGFSLVDQVEEAILKLVRNVDEEFALRRIQQGRLLRIGLTDSRTFPRFRRNPNAYVYVDKFENLEEIISACILSSYIPGLTGPLSQRTLNSNGAVRRANRILMGMVEKGCVKDALGLALQGVDERRKTVNATRDFLEEPQNEAVMFWDGGLTNVFPTIDSDTCIITPFSGRFRNPSISPSSLTLTRSHELRNNYYDRPEVCFENLRTLRYIAFSSESLALEKWFEQGFNDASQFLNGFNMTTDYSTSSFQVTTNRGLAPSLTDVYTAVRPQPVRSIQA